ncbi:hypothetical protein HU200_021941 [Digitaria exilis]|uniref:Glycosyltransferase n=1 Tax=Digitaria exilis TaxID=1010633 RepID=A0A835EXJ7_9POAL|nr:hypothetical protein HU200_021941 [Digitaria exilis]
MAAADEATAPHALLLPYPAQGHVIPFMELAHRLLDAGFAVTFVNTEFNHRRVVTAAAGSPPASSERLRLVGVADGMDDGEDRDNLVRLNSTMKEAMPPQLEKLLDGEWRSAAGDGDGDGGGLGKVTCVVVDAGMSWALDAAKRRGLPTAALWPASAAVFAVIVGAKKLIRDGVIDDDGAPVKLENNTFRLAESMAPMDATFLAWNYMGNADAERMVFHYLTTTAWAAVANADVLLCNTFADLEPDIFSTTHHHSSPVPTILPIGPLRTWRRSTTASDDVPVVGHFWRADDEACLSFLDAQPHGSVVYVAFGSLTVMSPAQLQELALALVASGRPFLWVFRPGLTCGELPTAVRDMVRHHGKGKLVEWAPQESVLAHKAIGCFVTHCGWNSTLEGIRNGAPLLCWPYFTDQFTNQTYICDVWKVGLRVASVAVGREGVVAKEEIVERLESLLGDGGIKERVNRLKDLAESSMSGEGRSLKNLNAFMESIRK